MLLEKGQIFGRYLFHYIDADETQVFTYANFLMEIPSDFAGVADVEYAEGQLVVREDGGQSRELTMEAGELFAW